MAKILIIAVIFPAILLVLIGGLFAVPANAQTEGPKESCKLTDDLKIRISFPKISGFIATHSIKEDSVVSPQIKDADNVKTILVSEGNQPLTEVAIDSSANVAGVKKAIEGKWGLICLLNTINSVTGWIFFVLISIAFIFILIAGFMWMTGRGEPEKQKQAGQMIVAALVGIVIAILARIIPGVVIGILT